MGYLIKLITPDNIIHTITRSLVLDGGKYLFNIENINTNYVSTSEIFKNILDSKNNPSQVVKINLSLNIAEFLDYAIKNDGYKSKSFKFDTDNLMEIMSGLDETFYEKFTSKGPTFNELNEEFRRLKLGKLKYVEEKKKYAFSNYLIIDLDRIQPKINKEYFMDQMVVLCIVNHPKLFYQVKFLMMFSNK